MPELDLQDRKRLVKEFLDELLHSGGISAGVGLVGTTTEVVAVEAVGRAVEEPASIATQGTLFDLASLTKPVVATLAVLLDERGLLPLDRTVGEIFRRSHPRLQKRRLGQLLRHRSGLAPWTPLFARCESRSDALDLLLSGEVLSADGETYSDLGYVLWGFAAEDSLGTPLSQLLKEKLFVPLEIHNMIPSPGPRPEVAQCRLSNDKEIDLARDQGFQIAPVRQIPHGTVQDGNARFLGGMAGNAGLFGTASSMWKLSREWLMPGRVLKKRDVADALGYGERYALGWWWRRMRGHAGPALSPRAFGMVGFTGGSCWSDPARGIVAVLLTHRRSPSFDLAPWRRRFHRMAVDLVAEMPRALAS
ncbi:MAG TPA: serine hydrolase domain-containing protein [Thermoanaerobaculia bacterium]|nr:serine hydrolase domain-containing protein [Thermoanaerobaculia bacterium]